MSINSCEKSYTSITSCDTCARYLDDCSGNDEEELNDEKEN